MPYPQESTTRADEMRSIRVDCLPPIADEIYLYRCFSETASVLAATVLRNKQTGAPLDYGFVEFTSHSDAETVLESYNGERMPNCNHERFCLTWDSDDFGTRWRVDYVYRECSFFGYDEIGNFMDCDRLIELMDSKRAYLTKKRGYLQTIVPKYLYFVDPEQAFPNDIENQLDHAMSNGSSPAGYLETDLDKRLKLTDTPLTHPNLSQNSDAHTVGQLTQVSTGNLQMLSSKKEKELYLCFEEVGVQRNCYIVRTIKLSELLQCSCSYNFESLEKITKCVNCTPKTKQEFQLRQRAWLYTGEKVPPGCGGKEDRIPRYMSCCAYGSRIIFAGGMIDPSLATGRVDDLYEPERSKDVYSFELESTIWKKLDWKSPPLKLESLLFHVNGRIYCLGGTYQDPLVIPDRSSGECLLLPEPEINSLGTDDWSYIIKYMLVDKISCAVVGSKIYISSMDATDIPVICFDVNDKEQKWRAVTSFFDGKPFPFTGRALVLDLNGKRDKVMFSFRERLKKYVSLLAVDDNGDISISDEVYLGCTPLALMRNYVSPLSHTYVDLGDQKVAFVTCANKFTEPNTNRCIVFIEICSYEVLDSGCIMSKVLATRTFENNCHSSEGSCIELTSAFVV